MPSTPTPTESDEVRSACRTCQHRVTLRGVDTIVCLVHLAAFSGEPDGACDEYEEKPAARPAGGSGV